MESVKTVVAGPEKTGPDRTVLVNLEVTARTVVMGTNPLFLCADYLMTAYIPVLLTK